jgi:hypothetical protein
VRHESLRAWWKDNAFALRTTNESVHECIEFALACLEQDRPIGLPAPLGLCNALTSPSVRAAATTVARIDLALRCFGATGDELVETVRSLKADHDDWKARAGELDQRLAMLESAYTIASDCEDGDPLKNAFERIQAVLTAKVNEPEAAHNGWNQHEAYAICEKLSIVLGRTTVGYLQMLEALSAVPRIVPVGLRPITDADAERAMAHLAEVEPGDKDAETLALRAALTELRSVLLRELAPVPTTVCGEPTYPGDDWTALDHALLSGELTTVDPLSLQEERLVQDFERLSMHEQGCGFSLLGIIRSRFKRHAPVRTPALPKSPEELAELIRDTCGRANIHHQKSFGPALDELTRLAEIGASK